MGPFTNGAIVALATALPALFSGAGTLAIGSASPAGAAAVPAQVSASNWTISPSVSSPGSEGNGISCVSANFCMALASNSLIEQWNGTAWSTAQAGSDTAPNLSAVTCTGPSFCLAVGFVESAGGGAYSEEWNGTTWTAVNVPLPAGSTGGALSAVSCVGPDACTGVGRSGTAGGNITLAEQWNGTGWSIESTPNQAGSTTARFSSVSCAITTSLSCMAVGEYSSAGGSFTLAERWNGSAWSITTTPSLPGGAVMGELVGVSCIGPSWCAAVGDDTVAGNNDTLAEVWDGTAWTIVTTPDPGVNTRDYLMGLSCFSQTSCSAVGDEIGTTTVSLAVTWDGSAWALATTPANGTGVTFTGLSTVSCVTDWECVAMGTTATSGGSNLLVMSAPIARSGYRFVASDGGVFAEGAAAPFLGSLGGVRLNQPMVGMAVMPAGDGYDLVASDGGVFTEGSAQFYGSTGSIHLNSPIVGMALTPDGAGYWLVAADGGVFSFGDAQFYGSHGGSPLNKPVVGMAATPDGHGYYLVASDGGVFTYGDAVFAGSTGSLVLNKPVVGMAVTSAGGYYLVASDGGIFSFPSAGGPPFEGSTGNLHLNKPIVGMTTVANGYYLAGSDGGIFAFPNTNGPPFDGSTGSIVLNKPIVGVAS
jgi:hypothetical protein